MLALKELGTSAPDDLGFILDDEEEDSDEYTGFDAKVSPAI